MWRDFDIKTVFKSGKTLRLHLTKVKDTLPITTESSIMYSIPCSCGKVYVGRATESDEAWQDTTPPTEQN